jgi:hypothetical protein
MALFDTQYNAECRSVVDRGSQSLTLTPKSEVLLTLDNRIALRCIAPL